MKGVTIYRGDGEPIPRDLQLGNLRDSYYEDAYGSLEPPLADAETDGVTRLSRRHQKPHDEGKPR